MRVSKTAKDGFNVYAFQILTSGVVLAVILTFVRTRITHSCCGSFLPSPVEILRTALAGYYDVIYVCAVVLLFAGVGVLFAKHPRGLRCLWGLFALMGCVTIIFGYINITITQMLGGPFNYQWLYYSDFVRGIDTWNAILAQLSLKMLLFCAALVTGWIELSHFLHVKLYTVLRQFRFRSMLKIAGVLFTVGYLAIAHWWVGRGYLHRSKLQNAVVSLAGSFVTSRQSPKLLTMRTDWAPADFRVCERKHERSGPINVQNVLIFVMESVAARYLEPFGGEFAATPELRKYVSESALFHNIYAHAPATNYSMLSILKSFYPPISYKTKTEQIVSVPSLSEVLKKSGYRTSFLNSGDNRFQNADKFLALQGFDRIADRRTMDCQREVFVSGLDGMSLLDGTDDDCLVDAFFEWLDLSGQQPFFTVLWTMMTHYPYFITGEEIEFGTPVRSFNRYLNALRHDDQVFGRLMRLLEERGLRDTTLVVVLGDHGEAFGDHDQYVHANGIYEENLHIPLMLIHPAFFHGESYRTIGGLIDIAPTILDVLNLSAPESWQGCTLFEGERSKNVYFFALWSGILFGYRNENMKFIYNALSNEVEIYDLLEDPMETNNLVRLSPDLESAGISQLAGWVQYQSNAIKLISQGQE